MHSTITFKLKNDKCFGKGSCWLCPCRSWRPRDESDSARRQRTMGWQLRSAACQKARHHPTTKIAYFHCFLLLLFSRLFERIPGCTNKVIFIQDRFSFPVLVCLPWVHPWRGSCENHPSFCEGVNESPKNGWIIQYPIHCTNIEKEQKNNITVPNFTDDGLAEQLWGH